MKKIFIALPVAAIVAVGLVACSDDPSGLAPVGPDHELVDLDQRISAPQVNAWVFGSFGVDLGGGTPQRVILGANGDTVPANFPSINVFYGGHCVYGKWHNPKGKATSGSMDRPHPHCVEWVGGTGARVILEPISSRYTVGSNDQKTLMLGHDEACDSDDMKVKFVRGGNASSGYPNSETDGCGEIVAHAIDESTIWDTVPTRLGTLTLDLGDYAAGPAVMAEADLFDTDCGGVTTINGLTVHGCLTTEITAMYTPAGGGTPQPVDGLLYWETGTRTGSFFNEN